MNIFSIICITALTATGAHDIAVIDAGEDAVDTKTVASAVKAVERLLAAEGVKFDCIGEKAVARGGLDGRAVAILPNNPQPSDAMLVALEKFIHGGGRLFVCYSLPKRLGTLLGFEPLKWQRGKRPGHFAEIRFQENIPGMPKSVKQASWNINSARPVAYNARVVAQWHDDQGNSTGQPAMLVSDRGAFLTHIVLPDDPLGKRKMLLATLGHLAPVVWKQAYERRLEEINQVGHCRSLEELAEHMEANNAASKASVNLESAITMLANARLAAQEKQFPRALAHMRQARDKLDYAYLRAQPSPKVEARGWWNHSGSGPYAGDWDRALAELSASGFNMIFPNMLGGGVAHYPSDILPRSKTYEKYGDQIAQCLAAAKKYGVEVHVWTVNYNLSHIAPEKFVDDLRRRGRTQVSAGGQPQDWLCPSHPDNLKLEVDSMVEVVEKYDVDGLHFDYIRYPGNDHCYCHGCRKRFETSSGKKVKSWPEDCYRGARREEYRDWRCAQITKLVAAVARRAKTIRKDVKISAAVFGSYPACRDSVGQDWVHWAKSGYVDFLCPMDYTAGDARFQALVKNQLRLLDGCVPIYPGIGATAARSSLTAARVVGQVHHARKLGAGGFTIFNLGGRTIASIAPGFGLGAGKHRAIPPHAKR